MPELPEVQTVINYLKDNILNLKINSIEIKNSKFLKNETLESFKNKVTNKVILDIFRIGKYLVFVLSNNLFMIVHLRMEGKFFIDKIKKNRKHDYLVFDLSDGKFLSYNDSRQFGTFHLTNNLDTLKEIKKVAIDPLNNEFTTEYFWNRISSSKKNIKLILLDQTIVSGIGNIYASEILFESKINPFKKANELTKDEISKIVNNSKKILKLAIKYNGTTIHSFSFGNNQAGDFTKYLKVVFNANKKCPNCNSTILKVKQQSRSTYYCPICQK